ncbi:MAG: class I SAM-dependent methyltransferase [Proteobacteria bacterium]|nr:class I SAM-dependent methyltransferase [Pseudomonadota bacterium]
MPAETRDLPRPLSLLLATAGRIEHGELAVTVPDGRCFRFAGRQPGPAASIVIRRARMVRRLFTGGTVGLAESYMDGDWETPDLRALLQLGYANDQAFGTHYGGSTLRLLRRLWFALRDNTRSGARRNIAHHYDLGNAFYARWLDPTMTYSSAVFAAPEEDLSTAQTNKYRLIAEKLAVAPRHHVLEIGCGWGGFAQFVAREYGCRVTAITVSKEQLEHTRAQIHAAGLADRVEARFQDYRALDGRFDRIASIEMFEAVGEKYWPAFFAKMHDCLVPGGRAALQVITIADSWFDRYRKGVDFIQRYVFPGGMLPSPSALSRAITAAGLAIDGQDYFGGHYAQTLKLWYQRFQSAWPDIAPLGFDARFKRLWEFYLAYCEAGFRGGSIDVTQVAVVRP